MPTAKRFADTNVAIYAVDADVAKRKLARSDAHELARALMATSDVSSVTPTITELAMNIGEHYQISHWDALVVAAALATGCDTLYSEDLQDGQVFEERLTVKNPFAGS